jgi:hypothetical protein
LEYLTGLCYKLGTVGGKCDIRVVIMMTNMTFRVVRQTTSFIDISIEAGILL